MAYSHYNFWSGNLENNEIDPCIAWEKILVFLIKAKLILFTLKRWFHWSKITKDSYINTARNKADGQTKVSSDRGLQMGDKLESKQTYKLKTTNTWLVQPKNKLKLNQVYRENLHGHWQTTLIEPNRRRLCKVRTSIVIPLIVNNRGELNNQSFLNQQKNFFKLTRLEHSVGKPHSDLKVDGKERI